MKIKIIKNLNYWVLCIKSPFKIGIYFNYSPNKKIRLACNYENKFGFNKNQLIYALTSIKKEIIKLENENSKD